MSSVDTYLRAATRDNTEPSYRSALLHFEVELGGLLPASPDTAARYLAEHAEVLAINTLQQRLAALADWHNKHGFPDPTKSQVVRRVLKGIRTLHPAQERQARPIQLDQVEQVVGWLDGAIAAATSRGSRTDALRYTRDRALLLLGFWRGFRGDELARLRAELIDAVSGEGMTCFLPQSKGDRDARGRSFKAPALRQLCPVDAYLAWTTLAGLTEGPVFRAVDRWGNVSHTALHINSLVPLLRTTFDAAGLAFAEQPLGLVLCVFDEQIVDIGETFERRAQSTDQAYPLPRPMMAAPAAAIATTQALVFVVFRSIQVFEQLNPNHPVACADVGAQGKDRGPQWRELTEFGRVVARLFVSRFWRFAGRVRANEYGIARCKFLLRPIVESYF